MPYDFLKPVLGDDLFAQFSEKMNAAEGITLANVSDGSFIPKAKFDEERNNSKTYKQQIEDLNARLDALQQAAEGNEALKGQIAQLQQDIAAKNTEMAQQRMEFNVIETARKYKARNPELVARMIDKSKITENNGTVYGLTEQFDALKKAEAYLFDDYQDSNGGFDPHKDPGGGKSGNAAINDVIRRAAGY